MINKLYWANLHRDMGELAMDVLGAESMLTRYSEADEGDAGELEMGPAHKLFFFSRSDTIYGGSDEIQRNVIGERASDCPASPADRAHARHPAHDDREDPTRPSPHRSNPRARLLDGCRGHHRAAGSGSAARWLGVPARGARSSSPTHERRVGETADALGEEFGTRPVALRCDVTSEDDVQALYSTALEDLGHIDVWMNNAGLGGNGLVTELTDDQWSKVLDVTLTGTFRCLRAVLPHLYERGQGAIVNNASVLGWRAQDHRPTTPRPRRGDGADPLPAIEAAEHGVRVNAVAPSLAMHPNLEKVTPPGLLEELKAAEAFGRGAEPWEVANVMVFLASDLSSYMTGEVVPVSSQHA
jgi:3-oxoacyl-[acyl-carrier protein] reductase